MQTQEEFYDGQSPEWKAAFDEFLATHRGEFVKPHEVAIFRLQQALDQHSEVFNRLAREGADASAVIHELEGILGGNIPSVSMRIENRSERPSQRYYLGRYPFPKRQKGDPESIYAWEVLVFMQRDRVTHLQLNVLPRQVEEVKAVTSKAAVNLVSL